MKFILRAALCFLLIGIGGAQAQYSGLVGPNYSANVQTFTSSGTWVKPAGINFVRVYAYAGGTGAYNGFACPNGSVCSGPSGPGGGSIGFWEGPASILPSTVRVTVGAAGASGSSPSIGGASTFGVGIGTAAQGLSVGVPGGLGGAGGVAISVNGGNGAGLTQNVLTAPYVSSLSARALSSLTGGSGGTSNSDGSSTVAGAAIFGAPGAGSGGGISASGTPNAGGASAISNYYAKSQAGAICSSAPTAPSSVSIGYGLSGSGGGSCASGPAGNGGNGGFPGGSAGGGGDGYNGTTPGTAGNPAAGEVVVISW